MPDNDAATAASAHQEAQDAVAEYKRRLNLSGAEAFARRAALSGGRPPPQVYGRDAGGGGGGGGGGGPPSIRDGDWTCPKCNSNVFASKQECFKCQTPRPEGLGPPRSRGGGEGGGGGGGGSRDNRIPEVNTICKGKVVRVETYGAFIELPGYSKWGLVHVSQLSDVGKGGMKIETKDVVDMGDEVWVKVCEVEPEAGKMSLSMKYVSQASGRDLDPEGAEYECEKNRRGERGGNRNRDQKITIDDPMMGKGQFREGSIAFTST